MFIEQINALRVKVIKKDGGNLDLIGPTFKHY